uniref:Mitochondrial nucleoid factor 1 n=1 Tax=Denticeps clupeoides TaxID=299321 RepID=A0AAY4A7W4_9TELE
MSATRYRRFLKLCEEWPRDDSKKGRDLGTFLRQRVAQAFREGENTQISDPEKCDQMYESLARINSNTYREKFPRAKDTSFTGVTAEECRVLLSTGKWGRCLKRLFHVVQMLDGRLPAPQETCSRWMNRGRACGRVWSSASPLNLLKTAQKSSRRPSFCWCFFFLYCRFSH